MSYPDFFCMGFQKCGTTTLFAILKQHPEIALARDVKESMYYRIPFAHIIGGGSRYYNKRYFGHLSKGDKRLTGEVNAGLTYSDCAGKLAANISPNTKMIFMMRNPIDRAYSAYKYFLARGFLSIEDVEYDKSHGHAEGFHRYVKKVLTDREKRKNIMRNQMKYIVFSQSNYGFCIKQYLKHFKKENMNFVIFEDFIKDQKGACQDIYRFLGVNDCETIDYNLRINEGNECPTSALGTRELMVTKGMKYFLYEFIAMPHWAPKTYDAFATHYKKVRDKVLVPDKDRDKMLPKTRKILAKYFYRDVRELEKITGYDLAAKWNI